ncbi:uncharacterized protein LOC144436058 [Glandiceps talaboti]
MDVKMIEGSGSMGYQSSITPEPPTGYNELLRDDFATMKPPITPRPSPPPQGIEYTHVLNFDLSKDEAKNVLLLLAFEDRYPESVVENLKIGDISTSYAKLYYQLYLFCEVRIVRWAKSPYRGGPLDDGGNGTVPSPWEVPVRADKEFLDHRKTVYVPHSENVRSCSYCDGKGYDILGYETIAVVRCNSCDGRGWNDEGRCAECNGTGRKKRLKGSRLCWFCDGHRRVKWHIEMTVYYFTRTADYLMDNPSTVGGFVSGSAKTTATPIQSISNEQIKSASRRFADKHLMNYPYERILQQRARVAPSYEVRWVYKRKKGSMWIYGDLMKAESTNLSAIK